MRAFLTAVALATLMAAPALAQTRESPAADPFIRNEILRHYDSAWPD
jgi:hypothetical protein